MNVINILRVIILFSIWQFPLTGLSQNVLSLKIGNDDTSKSLLTYLNEIEVKYPVRFYYEPEWLENISLESQQVGLELKQLLDSLPFDISYYIIDKSNIVLLKDPSKMLLRNSILTESNNSKKRIERIVIGTKINTKSNRRVRIWGEVIDLNTNRPIEGASVQIAGTSKGLTTNKYGRFEVDLEAGFTVLLVRSIGHEELVVDMEVYTDGYVNFGLNEEATLLNEVIITNKIAEEIVNTQMGVTRMDISEMKDSPSLLGQPDLIKQLQLYSGVNAVGPAAAGFNVRGGGADQNLVLFDGMPVFNTSHAFGFFSSFNPDAILDVNFYKSSLQADLGGRISSVLDVRSREGSTKSTSFSYSMGLVSSNVSLGGPLIRDKTSFLISSRFTFSDWLFKSIHSNYFDLSRVGLSFNDWSIKFGHQLSKHSKLTLSGYLSGDRFKFREDTTYSNSSELLSLQFDKQISPSLALIIKLGIGRYNYSISSLTYLYRLSYDIEYPSFDFSFLLDKSRHKMSLGFQSILYKFNPGELEPLSHQSLFNPINLQEKRAIEAALFINDEFSLNKRLSLSYGIRLPFFASIGPGQTNHYAEGLARHKSNVVDTLFYRKGEIFDFYHKLEPRISARYLINKQLSIKISYNRINQFMNLVTNTAAITPFDIWQPSNLFFKPQRGDQIAIGVFRNFRKAVNISLEYYYKYIKDIVDFKNGAELVLNNALETELLQGTSNSYGIEFSIIKKEGRLTGLFNYSYARSFRRFPIMQGGGTINGGRSFPSNYDQPNMLNFNLKYEFSRRYSLASNFTFRTGRPFTIPVSIYEVENVPIISFANRNEFRMPDYHHLDVSFNMKGNLKRKKIIDSSWSVSIYNLYARKNAYSVYYNIDEKRKIKSYRLSVIGTVIPSITYSVKL